MTARAAVYCRVSSAEQAGADHVSLQVQEERCRAFARQQGADVVAVEVDAESGLKTTRAGYQRILQLARAGDIDAVIVFQASRFGRDAIEVLVRAKELRQLGVALVSTSEDLQSPFMLGLQAVINEEESRRLSARVRPAKRLKASQGYWLGHAPFGTTNDRGTLRPGPHFDLVRLAFELAAEGTPAREINRRLNAVLAPRYLHLSTVRKMLRNPVYIGRVLWDGIDADARWEPMIDPALFARAGDMQQRRYRERAPLSPAYPFWILGLAFCGRCGGRMVAKVSVKTWGRRYAYLVCNRPDKQAVTRGCRRGASHFLIDDVQAWVLAQLEELAVDAESVTRLVERIADEQRRVLRDQDDRVRQLRAERDRLERRLQRAKAAHLDDPDVFTFADLKRIDLAVKDNVAAIDQELSRPGPEISLDVAELQNFLLGRAWLALAESEPAAFRDLLRRFMTEVRIDERGAYTLTWREAVQLDRV